jgi:hypothetical protein
MDYRTLSAQPRPEINTRDEKYGLEMAKYFYGSYADNQCMVGNGFLSYSSASIKELRDHGMGIQNIEQYRNIIDPPRKKADRRVYNANISWRVSDQYQKYKNILKSKIQELILTPRVDATSNDAVRERDFLKNLQALMGNENTKAFVGEDYPMPETTQDSSVLDQLGGIRLEREIVAKDVIDVVTRNSGMESLVPMFAEDLINIALTGSDFKVINGIAQHVYIDPQTFIIPRDYHEDFRKGDYRGYWEYQTLAELQAQYPDCDVKKLKQFEGVLWDWGEKINYAKFGKNPRNVKTVTMYWIGSDPEVRVVGLRKNGARQFESVPPNFNLSERAQKSGKKVEKYIIQRMYKCVWAPGSDQVLEFGPVDVLARGKDRMYWPMTVICTQNKSITESVMPFNDDLQLDVFKLRVLKAKIAPGPRMILYKDMIMDSVSIGSDSYTIKDLINLYQTEGIMILERDAEFKDDPSYGKPIEFMESGVLEDFKILQASIIDNINNIRSATGMNELVDGATPDMLKTVAIGLQQSSNSIIRPLLSTYVNFRKLMMKYVVLRQQQTVLAYGPQDLGVKKDGYNLTVVSAGRDFATEEFLVDVEIETQEMKNMLMQNLMERKDTIPPESYIAVLRAIDQGDLTKAQVIMLLAISRAQQQAHQRQIEIQQSVAKGNAEAGVAVEEARMNTENARIAAEIKSRIEELQAEFDFYVKKHPYELKLQEQKMAMQHSQALDVVNANNQNRLSQ